MTKADTPPAFRVAFGEEYVPVGEELEVFAQTPCRIDVLSVTRVGDEHRYQYVVIWDEDR